MTTMQLITTLKSSWPSDSPRLGGVGVRFRVFGDLTAIVPGDPNTRQWQKQPKYDRNRRLEARRLSLFPVFLRPAVPGFAEFGLHRSQSRRVASLEFLSRSLSHYGVAEEFASRVEFADLVRPMFLLAGASFRG